MSKDLTREERLAAQLRANLKRRKTQAKGMAARDAGESPDLSKRGKDS